MSKEIKKMENIVIQEIQIINNYQIWLNKEEIIWILNLEMHPKMLMFLKIWLKIKIKKLKNN